MLIIGENFLHYKVISAIGSGGMGEVFLAKDNTLERKVAIKVLRKKFGKSEDSLERFVREAKAASALNHPNIITIYEIGENDGLNYIAGEYIDGKTLHTRIANHDLSIQEILDITIQTCGAIDAAHAAGIIHRDIKPENIMVRKDGYVKVLDFGLAKLTEHEVFASDFDAVTHRLVQTNPGVVMGTVSYMSPEQTRGREIDPRSDIWSLGVVLFEMIAGRLPFYGDSTSDVIAAILTSAPAELSVYNAETPPELEQIVRKALQKDRDQRYSNVQEMVADLKDIRAQLNGSERSSSNGVGFTHNFNRPTNTGGGEVRVDTAPVQNLQTRSLSQLFAESFRQHPNGFTLGVAVFVLLAVAAALFAMFRATTDPGAFQSLRFAKITSSGKAEGGQAAISPDGKYVAYVVREGADQSLWVKNIPTDSSIQIIGPSALRYRGITFHPDSGFVYYVVSETSSQSSINRIPVLGGEAKRILTDADGPISFSPKGEQIAFVRNDRVMMTAHADGNSSEEILKAGDDEVLWLPTWSPDGETIAFTSYSNSTSRVRLNTLRLDTKERKSLDTNEWLRISGLAWNNDGTEIRISGRDLETQLSQIWAVALPDGALTRITNDTTSYQGLSVSSDGRSAVSVQENRVANIWVAGPTGSDEVKKITSDVGRDEGMSGIALAPDGSVLYTTRIAGTQDIWSVDADGRNSRQITANSGSNFHPKVSPDGKIIVFISDRAGSLDIWKMDRDGSNPTRVTDLAGNETRPAFALDGTSIVFQRNGADGRASLWKIPLNGGEPVKISPDGASKPSLSPDGKNVAFEIESGGQEKLGIISIDSPTSLKQFEFPEITASSIFEWSDDGNSLIYVNRLGGEFELRSQPIHGGKAIQLFGSRGDRIYAFDISRNGKGMVFSRGTESSDVMMIGGIR